MSSRKRKSSGPQSAAGLVRFFEDVESKLTISPVALLVLAAVFVSLVVAMNLLIK